LDPLIMNPGALIHGARSAIRRHRDYQRLAGIYSKYASYTMIPPADYLLNLQLAETVKAVPGAVVECGVWKGGMIAGIAEVLGGSREYILCDSFQGLPAAQVIDGPAALAWQSDTAGPNYHDNCTASPDAAHSAMSLSPARRVQIRPGWFDTTLAGLQLREGIALLRLDADWYESTMTCLERLYPLVNPGGLMVVDDYYTWDGCARAVHEFLTRRGLTARVRQWADTVCYVRVPPSPQVR
jgi:O-methyltransferase